MYSCDIIAVTNRHLSDRPLTEQLLRVFDAGVSTVILREKDLSEDGYEKLASEVLALCSKSGKTCILHSFTGAARRLGCRRIHLPFDVFCRAELSGFDTVGVSVHSPDEALRAQKRGASYLTAGHIFPTDCKKGVPPRGLEFLKSVCGAVKIPVYAIGGITENNASETIKAGAFGVCVMSGMMTL